MHRYCSSKSKSAMRWIWVKPYFQVIFSTNLSLSWESGCGYSLDFRACLDEWIFSVSRGNEWQERCPTHIEPNDLSSKLFSFFFRGARNGFAPILVYIYIQREVFYYCLAPLISLFICWFQSGLIGHGIVFFSHNKPASAGLISPETNQRKDWISL